VSSVSGRQGYERVVTPEAVALELDVAGLGSRGIAIAIDMLIQLAGLLAIVVLLSGLDLGETGAVVILAVSVPMIFWGYFFVFEGFWNGRTPGKRAQRLRVTRTDGQPMSGGQMFIRNLLRIVDFLPVYYVVGATSMIVTSRSQRLGDLAAGTLVIREPKVVTPVAAALPPPPPTTVSGPAGQMDASAMTEAHYQLVRSFLERRRTLDATTRSRLAGEIAAAVRPAVRADAGIPNEAFLEAAATAYRLRSRGG
jgi:uncharacterized RDD family membrane protein YckC